MNARASKILMNWIIHVTLVLLPRDDPLPGMIKRKLVDLTAQLQAAMDEGRPLRPPSRGK